MQSLLENAHVRKALVKLDVNQYHRLCTSGIVSERTELLDGVVVEKMGKSPRHSWTVGWLEDWFRQHLRPEFHLRAEQPLTLGNSEPEPDLAVVEGSRSAWRDRHPSFAFLVVEVAITTEDLDQAKAMIYAKAGIPRYLLVLPSSQRVIEFSNVKDDIYQSQQIFVRGDVIPLVDLANAELKLDELF